MIGPEERGFRRQKGEAVLMWGMKTVELRVANGCRYSGVGRCYSFHLDWIHFHLTLTENGTNVIDTGFIK